MKQATAYTRKLTALIKKIRSGHDAAEVAATDPLSQLVLAFLEWNSTRRQAELAYQRIFTVMVDHNDLRVSHLREVVDLLGPRYPQAEERAARMKDAMQAIYNREHAMSLASLEKVSKKEARAYLDGLPGMTQYVAAAVVLLSLGGHAVPVDAQLAQLLREHDVVDPDASDDEIASFVERNVKADEAIAVHSALRAWVESAPKKAPSRKTAKPSSAKSSTKKKAASPDAQKRTTKTTKAGAKTTKKTSRKITKKK